jgi:hypothetical protein
MLMQFILLYIFHVISYLTHGIAGQVEFFLSL